MSQTYSGGEVLFIAMQIEQNGAQTYRQLGKRNPGLADLYNSLAADEDEHYAVFARLRADAGKAGVVHEDQEALTYLDRVAGSFVFDANADPMEPFAGLRASAEVFDVAIGLEQKSIALYEALIKTVSGQAERRLIRQVIEQEKQHIATLTKARDSAGTTA